jgi:hypothetical protein
MTDEHIEKTKSAIESAENIPADRKTELLNLPVETQTSHRQGFGDPSRGCPEHRSLSGGIGPRNNSHEEKTGTKQETFARTETIRGTL